MDQLRTKWLVLVFATCMPIAHVIMGLANTAKVSSLWQYLLAMVICLGLVVLLCVDMDSGAIPLKSAWLVVAGVVVMELLVTSVLPLGIHPGYAAWQNGAIQMLLVALAFRGRTSLAWLGMGAFAALDMRASLGHGLSLVDGLALVLTPIMWMVIATAVLMVLGRSRNNIAVYSEQSQKAALRLAWEEAHNIYRAQRLLELQEATRPELEAIACSKLTDEQRRELTFLEAGLRDQMRGRTLVTGGVPDAALAARKRGVKVDLLDDRKAPLPGAIAADVSRKLLEVLAQAQAGTVRVRALPVGEVPTVTFLAFDESADQFETYAEISVLHSEPDR